MSKKKKRSPFRSEVPAPCAKCGMSPKVDITQKLCEMDARLYEYDIYCPRCGFRVIGIGKGAIDTWNRQNKRYSGRAI